MFSIMASFIEFFHKNGGFGDNDAPTNVAQALLQGFFLQANLFF